MLDLTIGVEPFADLPALAYLLLMLLPERHERQVGLSEKSPETLGYGS
jgi:hypothetical protein